MEQKAEENKSEFRCGMVAIVGRPNVGKSTLLNAIVEEKVAIVSKVPQTTRHQIRGIYNDERCQIIFVDTPGLHTGKDTLDKLMNQASTGNLSEVDCIVHVVDTSRHVNPEEDRVIDKLKHLRCPIVLGLNKIDLEGRYVHEYIQVWEKARGKKIQEFEKFSMVALSGQAGTNVKTLIDVVREFLPVGPALYPTDIVADFPKKLALADIVREKLLNVLREEVPHSIGIIIEKIEEKKNLTAVYATIYVERESQKEIVIGKGGSVLKRIGSSARIELEDLLEHKVFLDLHVKAQRDWRDNIGLLQDMGHSE